MVLWLCTLSLKFYMPSTTQNYEPRTITPRIITLRTILRTKRLFMLNCILLNFQAMLKKTLVLTAIVIMSCQRIPSASVPDADSSPIQLLKTSLQVTVRNNIGNVVEGAEVQLFTSKEDYQQETNPVGEVTYTDDKGRVKFIGIEPREYYLNVEKGDLNNYGAGIKTDSLVAKRMNKVTIIIE